MDGLWPSAVAQEQLRQARFVRHRLLTFNLDPAGGLNEGDASSYGSVSPLSISPGTTSARGLEGGPHFILSPETPDGRPTLGFEWALVDLGGGGDGAVAGVGGFTVTIWVMIGTTMSSDGTDRPEWASFEPLAGVAYQELYHSFDTNATALRFQITNYDDDPDPVRSICVAIAEL